MNNLRSVVTVSCAVSLGAVVSCLSLSSTPDNSGTGGSTASGGSAGSGGNTGDTGGAAGSAATTVTGGAAGSTDTPPGGTGGTAGATGAGGSGGDTGTGGSAGATGAGGAGGSGPIGTDAAAGRGGAGGASAPDASVGRGGSTGTDASAADAVAGPPGACDILAAGGNPCVAAHSTTRALYANYTRPLYQVCKGAAVGGPNSCPGGVTLDIGPIAGGYANSAAQDAFCAGGACTISIIYDQGPNGNHLRPAPRGTQGGADLPANAADLKVTMNGHSVYGIFTKPSSTTTPLVGGYRAGCTGCGTPTPRGIPVGDEPETLYMVTSMNGLVDGCCFDYGNAETTSSDLGNGYMEALYFGGGVSWGTGSPGGHANGPWIMADLEDGLYAGWERAQDQNISTNTPLKFPFVTGVLVGDVAAKNAGAGRFAIYGGDATTGVLKTMYDGIRPAKPGYVPMRKQGSIILGIGGDNSDSAGGQWFEGVMTTGAATVATVNALQANIVAAGYGK